MVVSRTHGQQQLNLWRQMVDHENSAKQNYEYFTGDVTAQKFYQGRLKNDVDEKV